MQASCRGPSGSMQNVMTLQSVIQTAATMAEIPHQPRAFHIMQMMYTSLLVLAAGSAARTAAAEDCQDAERASFSLLQAHVMTKDMTRDHKIEEAPQYWASGRGNYPEYAVSNYSAPFHLGQSLAWSWHHPDGRFATLTSPGSFRAHPLSLLLLVGIVQNNF